MKKSFDICDITVDDPTKVSCYLKASNANNQEIFPSGEEEILMNDAEVENAMLDNILVVYLFEA